MAELLTAKIERALREAGEVRRLCNFRLGRGDNRACRRPAQPGSHRCGHHWPLRYPVETRR
jgi:hypothetical protein